MDVVLDHGLEGGIPEDELVHQHLQGQCRVTTPRVEVYALLVDGLWHRPTPHSGLTVRVLGRGTGDHEARTGPRDLRAIGADIIERALQGNGSLCGDERI